MLSFYPESLLNKGEIDETEFRRIVVRPQPFINMPITLTFDVEDADNNQRNRVQELFEKLGWQNVGGSSYRYPPLGQAGVEDWLNHVIPALMLFRKYLQSSNRVTLTKFSLDAQTSTGYDPASNYGSPPVVMVANHLVQTATNKFTVDNLLDWINTADYPYP